MGGGINCASLYCRYNRKRESEIKRESKASHWRKQKDIDRNGKWRKCRYSRGSKRKKNKQEMAGDRERGGALNWIEGQLKRERETEREKEKLLQCGFWCGDRLSAHQRS